MIDTSQRLILPSQPWPRPPKPMASWTLPELEDKVDTLHAARQRCEVDAAREKSSACTWTNVFRASGVGLVAAMGACAAFPPLGIGLWAVSAIGFAVGGWQSHRHEHAAEERGREAADCGRALERYEAELDDRRETLAEQAHAREIEAQARAAADLVRLQKMAAPAPQDPPCVVISPSEVKVAGVTVPRNPTR